MDILLFNEHVASLTNPLYRFALWKTGNKEIAEEIVQDAFIKLWQLGDKINNYDKLDGLAFKILRNLCIDFHRKRKLKTVDVDFLSNSFIELNNPQKKLESKENFLILDKAIKKLPKTQQLVFFLRNIEAYSLVEISNHLDMKLNTVEVTLSRARKKLRQILNETK